MSIVGSLLSQPCSKLGARKIAMLVLNAFFQLVHWSASLTWWPSSKFGHHICRWASGVGKKICEAQGRICLFHFLQTVFLQFIKQATNPRHRTSKIHVEICWNLLSISKDRYGSKITVPLPWSRPLKPRILCKSLSCHPDHCTSAIFGPVMHYDAGICIWGLF